ncbi:MAG: Omp28-related outer membrane protein [Porphyromonas sp.]|nr:Omp28-related outer membrane protein [Porphyromonas sp.]
MSKLSNLLILFAIIFIAIACREDKGFRVTKLQLNADKTSILCDGRDIATFTVKDQGGQDCTHKVLYKVNGKDLSGPKFSTDKEGVYTIVAYLGKTKSNEIRVTATEKEVVSLLLKVDRGTVLVDGIDRVSFRCYDATKSDGGVLKDATYYVNGALIESDSYLPKSEGIYKIVARIGNRVSPEVEVVAENNFKPISRILIEDYTATWCHNCPKVHAILETLLRKSFKFVPLMIHCQDELACPLGDRLMRQRGYDKMPTLDGNRKEELPYTNSEIEEKFANSTTNVGVALSVELKGGKVLANVVVRKDSSLSGTVRLLVAFYENGIKADQKYEGGVTKKNAIHDYVLRDFFESKYLGAEFKFDANNLYKQSVFFAPNAGSRPENCGVMVAVVDKDGVVLNTQYANVGQSRGY